MSSGGGGGGKTPANTTQVQTSIPKYAEPYAMQMLGQTSALTNINQNPYQSYQGQRVADFSPLQNQSFQNIQQMQPAEQIGQATGIAGLASLGGLGMAGSYDPLAGQNYYTGTAGEFDQAAAQKYMNPYMQSVVGIQQREAQRQADMAKNTRGAQAATSGAFGGNRQAFGDFEANRNLALQMGDIQSTGLNTAYTQAQQQFNADQARQLQNAGMSAQYGLAGAQLGEQSRQYGAGLGLQGIQAALQGASTMGQLGEAGYNQQMGITQAQNQMGAQQQALQQQGLQNQYQEFLNKMNYPYQQLGFMSDVIHGLPTQQSSTIYQPTNTVGQVAGLAGGLGSLYAANQTGNPTTGTG